MNKHALVILGLLTPFLSLAQPYGNEWIDHSLTYYRFNIVEEGIYRLDSATLAASGVPITTIDPNDLMLFSRQKQVPILIHDGGDGSLDSADYVEFYAQSNDGWFDTQMWVSPVLQPNRFFSMYNDTIRYYLTWSSTAQKERIHVADTIAAAGLPERDWFWAETWYEPPSVATHFYMIGERDIFGASSPFMVNGEGWFDIEYGKNWSNPANLVRERAAPTPYPYVGPGAPDATCTAIWAGTNNAGSPVDTNHHTMIHYGDPPSHFAVDTTFIGYKTMRATFPIPAAHLGTTSTKLKFEVIRDLSPPITDPNYPDYQAIGSFEIRYAHTFELGNAAGTHLYIPHEAGQSNAHIAFNGVPGTPMIRQFGDSARLIPAVFDGTHWRAVIPQNPNGSETHLYIRSANQVMVIDTLVPVNGTGTFTDLIAADPDSVLLIVTSPSLIAAAESYADLKSGNMMEPMNAMVVNVDELYDQFGGGIPKHALAIRKFCEMTVGEWTTVPRGLFLIGKSVKEVGFNAGDLGTRKTASAYALSHVPTYGYPPSDPAFTFGLGPDPNALAFPIGRLSAQDAQQVLDYENKVNDFESQPPAAWMKRILHFAGGTDAQEQSLLFNHLESFRTIAEDTCFGGSVTTFRKTSSNIIQQLVSDSLAALINDGVTMMTFFGHASGSGFDISIDNPTNYDWNGHFPLVIGNSCYTGNVHLHTSSSTSEQFVLLPDKGAIGFIASVDIGLTGALAAYTRLFYTSFSQTNYGKSIGTHQQYAVREQVGTTQGSLQALNNALTNTLHGDPSLVLNSWPKPEYLIEENDIVLSPPEVTTELDSFEVVVTLTNVGKATNDMVNVAVERVVNGSPQQPHTTLQLDDLYFQRTVNVQLPVLTTDGGPGPNTIKARVDRDPDEIPELDDDVMNNQRSLDFTITFNGLSPIYPYKYAIVPVSGPELKASTGDPFAPLRNYVFQIDTTDLFNSPMMEEATIPHVGGVVAWQPQSIYSLDAFNDSLVYFWRCSPDSIDSTGFSWSESSFQHIPGKRGWGQAHFFQFKNDGFDLIEYDRPDREFDFFTGSRNVRCDVFGMSSGAENNLNAWYIDLDLQEYSGCSFPPAFHVAVIEPSTFTAWGTRANGENPDHGFGNINDMTGCRSRVEKYFIFRTGFSPDTTIQSQLNGMLDMLQNHIPDGHHVLVWTWQHLNRGNADTLAPALLDELELMGANNIRSIPDSIPYAFFVTKGDPSSAVELWDTTPTAFISLSVFVDVQGNTGRIRSEVAGPATSWDALYWNEVPQDPFDSTSITVVGITGGGNEQELVSIHSPLDSLPDLETYADASVYPYLRIDGFFTDDSVAVLQPAQLERWQLLYDPVPECALDPSLGYYEEMDSLFQGQTAKVSIAVHNVSEYDMDSLLVNAWAIDQQGQRHTVHHQYHPPLLQGQVHLDTLQFSNTALGGLSSLIVEVNPVDSATGTYDQLEQFHFNNIAQISFETLVDRENPLLDVTFDGIHILNGDIVSARPEIMIQLDDENPVLLLDEEVDTANFRVFLTYPNGLLEQVYFLDGAGTEIMKFIPADGTDNISKIQYNPVFAVDGMYELRLQASDISNNASGDEDLTVQFEVINQATITNILNYPNPFTTRTQFVFTLTGSEVPTYMKIQIMTITGRVVREIGMHELGPLHVGRNITEYAWDGRDEFGDKLARGVYLYHVVAQLYGEDIEHRETSTSQYFKKGFGKMYLLR